MKILALFLIIIMNSQIHAASSPYTHKKGQEISSLSTKQTQQLLNGEGMGFALSAELNEYPGPKHVLELSDSLLLTPSQLNQTKSLFSQMNQQAKKLGAKLIKHEQQLDTLFRTGHISSQQIRHSVTAISTIQSELRALHLIAHIQQRDLLSPEQQILYQQLRGYSNKGSVHHKHSKAHHH
ncbi:MAG: hypothetical protein ACRBHB_19565 [Arenicella sp.]